MALAVPPPNDKKRVKVYELRNNDWFDRGTGFCTGQIVNVRHASFQQRPRRDPQLCFQEPFSHSLRTRAYGADENAQDESRIFVESEDQPERMLLETRIGKDDGYQKQQGIMGGIARSRTFG